MRILEVAQGCGLVIDITPADCYALARACRTTANVCAEETKDQDAAARDEQLYDALAVALEGFAIAGDAVAYMLGAEVDAFTVERCRAVWDHQNGRAS